MSAEAPVVVVKELENRDFCGGAAIVAAHIKKLGAGCKLISVIGDDKNGEYIKKNISKEKIEDGLIIDDSRPTTFKKRYLVENQKLFRVSRLEQCEINKDIESRIIKELEVSAKYASGIVVCDFVYGVITKNIIMLGFIDNLEKLYQECSLVIVPSTVQESFGLVTAEAMYNSRAVIGSNRGATPWLIKDNETGYIFNPDSDDLIKKIFDLIENKDKLKSFGRMGKKRIDKIINS